MQVSLNLADVVSSVEDDYPTRLDGILDACEAVFEPYIVNQEKTRHQPGYRDVSLLSDVDIVVGGESVHLTDSAQVEINELIDEYLGMNPDDIADQVAENERQMKIDDAESTSRHRGPSRPRKNHGGVRLGDARI